MTTLLRSLFKKQAKIIQLKTSNNEQGNTNQKEEKSANESKMASIVDSFNNKYGAAFTPNNKQLKNEAKGLIGDFCFNKL